MASVEVRPPKNNQNALIRVDRLRLAFQKGFDRLLSPTVVAVGFVILSYVVIRSGFELYRQYPGGVPNSADWFGDLWLQIYSNLGIEVLSIAITVIVIERLNRREAERERKTELILQMGSPDKAFAVEAVRILRHKGWGFDKDESLEGARLWDANLQGADLRGANLLEAFLGRAHLEGARLNRTHLQRAVFDYAHLQGAELEGANLQDAFLEGANLQGAKLDRANLRGASLDHAHLETATFNAETIFSEATTLPDESKWRPGRDMREFTDPAGWKAGKYQA